MTEAPQFGLTPPQLKLLNYLRSMARQPAPTYAEICAACGFKSKSSINRLIVQLEERGRIRRIKGKHGSVEVVGPPWELPPEIQKALDDYCKKFSSDPSNVIAVALERYLNLYRKSA